MSVLALGCLSQDVNVATGEDGVAKAAAITQMKPCRWPSGPSACCLGQGDRWMDPPRGGLMK